MSISMTSRRSAPISLLLPLMFWSLVIGDRANIYLRHEENLFNRHNTLEAIVNVNINFPLIVPCLTGIFLNLG